MIASALLALVLTCAHADEMEKAAETRSIYLGGEFDKVTDDIEAFVLATEIVSLEQLRREMLLWQKVNCKVR